jgi:hypothetical protein
MNGAQIDAWVGESWIWATTIAGVAVVTRAWGERKGPWPDRALVQGLKGRSGSRPFSWSNQPTQPLLECDLLAMAGSLGPTTQLATLAPHQAESGGGPETCFFWPAAQFFLAI